MHRRIFLGALAVCLSLQIMVVGASQRQKPKPAQPSPSSKPSSKEEKNPVPTTDAKPTASQTGKKTPVADNQWALLVGVSQYPGQIQSLGFPRDDAGAIKDLLVSAAGFPE